MSSVYEVSCAAIAFHVVPNLARVLETMTPNVRNNDQKKPRQSKEGRKRFRKHDKANPSSFNTERKCDIIA